MFSWKLSILEKVGYPAFHARSDGWAISKSLDPRAPACLKSAKTWPPRMLNHVRALRYRRRQRNPACPMQALSIIPVDTDGERSAPVFVCRMRQGSPARFSRYGNRAFIPDIFWRSQPGCAVVEEMSQGLAMRPAETPACWPHGYHGYWRDTQAPVAGDNRETRSLTQVQMIGRGAPHHTTMAADHRL